ncbi:zinc dependent phospholipase C family protein [Aedoeadaptatus pacaensis]|uniref:zinc dependent phospholipase C family protein n=1 Tax=Aedoeadaptatus pacaensis TaxID=1776390 RepID=UPI00083932A9|nr:zinc dependent phospholipase C family protein [Peptoniphilus pacaensis]
MASLVTHYFFARRLLPTLSEKAREIIAAYPDHYALGAQGPDMFFYYLTSKKHKVGGQIHAKPLANFLERNREWIEKGPTLSPTWAYFFGFLTHFSLDATVHPYIDSVEEKISIGHVALERDFDRVILEEEGYDPRAFLCRELLPSPAVVAAGISPLYESYGINTHDVHRAVASFRIGQQFFHVDDLKTYARKHKVLKALGADDAFGGMLLNPKGYYDSIYITNPVMKELMTLAYPVARTAVTAFTKGGDYPPFFQLDFNGR